MNVAESLSVAFRSLAANKVRSALTMLGVIIGVTSVVLLVALGEGARTYITKEFSGLGTNILIITPGKSETSGMFPMIGEAVQKLTFEDAEAVKRQARGVRDVAPVVVGQGYVKYRNRQRDTTIIGTTDSFQSVRQLYVDIGSFVSDADVDSSRRVVVIGRTVKKELFGNDNPLGQFVSISGTKFRIIGIMEQKGISLGFDIDDLIFMPVTSAQDIFNTDELFEILVSARSADSVDLASAEIERVLAVRHRDQIDFTITDQTAMISTFQTILDALTFVIIGIAAISLVVGGIGIMNIMLVSVRERIREIGVRKAVGARNRDIMLQFLIESVVLSTTGGCIGILLGAVGAMASRRIFPALPTHMTVWAVSTAFSFSIAVGVFFGVYPARKASLADPVEALRYE